VKREYFEWDEKKNLDNIIKHKISFEEAIKVFDDVKRITINDTKHSLVEDRMFCIGKIEERIATVRFTIRNEKIRILGAGFWRKGKGLYEKRSGIY
jgi:uncharacterized DUF497 family protein